jgi:hypothetical protein
VLELSVERLGLGGVEEVAALDAPPGDGVDDPVGDLLERRLPLRCAERAPEVLLGDDVGGVDRPVRRDLDAELLEGDRPVLPVGDAGVAPVPGDLVVGVDAGGREVPADADARLLRGQCHGTLLCVSRVRSSICSSSAGPGATRVEARTFPGGRPGDPL